MYSKKPLIVLKTYIIFFGILLLIILYNMGKITLSDLRYSIEEEEIKQHLIVDEMKEKGKETMYNIYVFDEEGKTSRFELSKEDYEKYIGSGNNAITTKKSILTLYIGTPKIFGSGSCFSGRVKVVEKSKILYPWERGVVSYTERDAEKLAWDYVDGVVAPNDTRNILVEQVSEFGK